MAIPKANGRTRSQDGRDADGICRYEYLARIKKMPWAFRLRGFEVLHELRRQSSRVEFRGLLAHGLLSDPGEICCCAESKRALPASRDSRFKRSISAASKRDFCGSNCKIASTPTVSSFSRMGTKARTFFVGSGLSQCSIWHSPYAMRSKPFLLKESSTPESSATVPNDHNVRHSLLRKSKRAISSEPRKLLTISRTASMASVWPEHSASRFRAAVSRRSFIASTPNGSALEL